MCRAATTEKRALDASAPPPAQANRHQGRQATPRGGILEWRRRLFHRAQVENRLNLEKLNFKTSIQCSLLLSIVLLSEIIAFG
jgi:hypothetical protein